MKTRFFILFVSVTAIWFSCRKEEKGSPGPNEIWLEYKAYNPSQLAVDSGATVTFTNKDNSNHSVTSSSGIFASGKISSGSSYTYTFNTVGTYYFYCDYHSTNSAEQGAIIVR